MRGKWRFQMAETLKAALLGTLVGGMSFVPDAGAVEQNICEKVIEDTLFPPQIEDVVECTRNPIIIALMPHCLAPTCMAHPECVTTRTIITAAEELVRAGEVHCSFREISAEELFEKWIRGRITNTADIALGGLPAGFSGIVQSHVALLAARGASLPDGVQSILNAVADRAALMGVSSFTRQDVQGIKIMSDTDVDADFYTLPTDPEAITLGPVIVMREKYFRPLVDATGAGVTLGHMLGNKGFPVELIDAVDTLVHEMIHVRQYRELGTESFQVNYLLEAWARGYGNDASEREAFTFAAQMADVHEGLWCSQTMTGHNDDVDAFGLGLAHLECSPFYLMPALLNMTW